MSGCALFQIATTLSMLGTQVQKDSVTFWPADAGADAAADDDVPAGPVEDELPDEEQPAAASAASAATAITTARLRRRVGVSFMVPPR
jgi:hypothetical protein